MNIAATLQLAANHVEAGRFGEAERLYRQVLASVPEEPNALYGLGFVALMAKAYDDAARLLSATVKRAPRAGHAWLHLGDAHRYAGRLKDAIRAYEKAARLLPGDPLVHNNLGAARQESEDYQDAVFAYRRAVSLAPGDPQYLANLGAALQKLGQNAEALACCERALAVAPDYVPALLNLGNVLISEGRYEEACAPFRRAIALQPELQGPRDNLAVALARAGEMDEAAAVLEASLAHAPTPLTYKELVEALIKLERSTEAERRAREGMARFPDTPRLVVSLGEALTAQGRTEEGIAAYRRAQSLGNGEFVAASSIAFLFNAIPSARDAQRAATIAAGEALAAKPVRPGPLRPRQPEKRLRVGYVSPDFRGHSVAHFFMALIAHHDRTQVEVVCYHAAFQRDAMTERIQAAADQWVDIAQMEAEPAARRIQGDRIDILVDLAGHTGGNRLDIFARRPAPIQITYLGYPNSTGLATMDYRITDALADPEGMTDADYTETLLRLPRVFLAFSSPQDAPPVERGPVTRGEPFTFGSFNAIHKLSDFVLELWARVLEAVPDSRLLLKTLAFADAGVADRIRGKLESLGVAPERITLLGFEKERSHHLAIYHRVDVALDTFPYHGTTTTCEAMYMGVPVITLAGDTHASRVGVSLLNAVGLPELVADSPEAFVHAARRLATDRQALDALRQDLRQRLSNSPLMDGAGLARAIESVYRQVWRQACAN